ncbi:MAG: efflux transporter outer membrane subunit, partial [Gammaproteobacteria bacterium]|nr:efflux transporter outer membrane subunit [Gammaproteobacteria bacterium]
LPRPDDRVASPAPARWHTALPGGAGSVPHDGSMPALADWWSQLGDPVLVGLIEAAEAASPDLASAAARISEARSSRVAAGAALLPNLDGSLSASRSAGLTGSTGAPGATGAGATAAPGTGTAGSTAAAGTSATSAAAGSIGTSIPITTYQAGLQSSWEIDLFGRLRANRDATQARLSAADARWHQARVSVAAETATTYLGERACQRQLAVADSDARSRAETARLSRLSADAGFTAPADAALARAGAADASARLTQQRSQCALQRQALVALTGLDADAVDRRLAAAATDAVIPKVDGVTRVPASALAQRPDVYAAEQNVAAASAEAGAALAQRFPRLSLQGSIGRLKLSAAGFSESLNTWSIGPLALTVPIFDGGTLAANADAARSRYDEAVALYRSSVRQAVREVEEALIKLQDTTARAADADDAVKNYQASFDATQARYQSGLASQFELEDARRTLFTAQTARVTLQRESAEAWVSLYRSMGGGWTRPAPDGTQTTSLATTPPDKE